MVCSSNLFPCCQVLALYRETLEVERPAPATSGLGVMLWTMVSSVVVSLVVKLTRRHSEANLRRHAVPTLQQDVPP